MERIRFLIILPLLVLSLFPSYLFATTRGIRVTAEEGQNLYLYKDYHAIVVGISNYERWSKLPNAVNDAKEVAAKLKELGFAVKVVLDPTSREMKTVMSEMVYKIGRERNRALLFYYAGHGETETLADRTKMGYIIPKDCPLLEKDPMGFDTHAISMREIESASLRIRSKHVIMLFDSCFSGALFASVRAVPHDITEKSALPVRQYITAGREDEQVPDKSMFKRCFLVGLEGDADLTGDGYITGSELGMYLSNKVVNYTHRMQHPQYGKINNPDLDRGDFIFNIRKIQASSVSSSSISLGPDKQRLIEEREQLERQRRKVKRLKMEIERKKLEVEQKRLEAEKKKLETAKIKELEGKHKAAEEKARKEAAEKKALEEERIHLKSEKKKLEMAKLPLQHKYTGLKLAVLPSKLVGSSGIDKVLTDALDIVFKKTKLFMLLFSYYNLKNDDTRIIDKKFIGKNTFDNLWVRKSIFSNLKPNIPMLSTVGEQLEVDAVLIYYIEVSDQDDYINVFLINIKNRKVYDANGQTLGFFDYGEGLPEIIRLTKKVFSDYKSEQK